MGEAEQLSTHEPVDCLLFFFHFTYFICTCVLLLCNIDRYYFNITFLFPLIVQPLLIQCRLFHMGHAIKGTLLVNRKVYV